MLANRLTIALLILGLAALASCESPPATDDPSRHQEMTDPHVDVEPALSMDEVRDVMLAKLVYSRAIFEAMTLNDMQTVAVNADEIRMIANTAAFRPHRTVSYGLLSDEFSVIADQMATAARSGDVEGVQRDYLRMTDACVRCHTYLRDEAPTLELPGSVSFAK